MKLYTPDYYPEFHCISSQCRHSCCVGWEIDLDKDTLAKYAGVSGSLGRELERNIAHEADGTAHFILQGREERCPFLREDGLCRLILELGEDSLSQICTDHPRFRNFFSGRVEMGLGLCCEEAARLVVSRQEPFRLILHEDDGAPETMTDQEQAFFPWRQRLLDTAQDRSRPLSDRLEALAPVELLTPARWLDTFRQLEVLDDSWLRLLDKMEAWNVPLSEECALPLEQLLCCFLYRHLAGALEDGCLMERAAFSVLSVGMIFTAACALENSPTPGLAALAEAARMYSSETEYSDQNVQTLLELLEEME